MLLGWERVGLHRLGDRVYTFACSQCGSTFERTGNTAACVLSRQRRRGYVFCSKSCGMKFRHGYADGRRPTDFPSEYRSWCAMRQRCFNPNNESYARYGGRFDVPHPPEWTSFKTFLSDMGPKPSPRLELERVNNDLPYSKDNCIWANHHTQTRNRGGKRATRLYTYAGLTLCIKDWADLCGIAPASMQKRLNKGWPLERAFAEAGLPAVQLDSVVRGR